MKKGYLFFPYLKTSSDVEINGLTLSSNKKPSRLETEDLKHIQKISSIFYLENDYMIDNMVCSVIDISRNNLNKKGIYLTEIQNLIGYLYSFPDDIQLKTILKKEHVDFYLFIPELIDKFYLMSDINVIKKEPEENIDYLEKIEGYVCYLNNEYFGEISDQSRIYPPYGNLYLNSSQDLYKDLNNFLSIKNSVSFHFLFRERKNNIAEIEKRIFTSLKWYMKSNSLYITEEEEIIFIAISLESLLRLSDAPNITIRFKETVKTIIGPIPKLDEWLDQFYKARSELVHKGTYSTMMFFPNKKNNRNIRIQNNENDKGYRRLASYGRKIFEICFESIITGYYLSISKRIESLFKTNSERFIELQKKLDEKNNDPIKLLISVNELISEIDKYRFLREDIKNKLLFSVAKKMITMYLKCNPPIDRKLKNLFIEFISCKKSNEFKYEFLILNKLWLYQHSDRDNLDINNLDITDKEVLNLIFRIIDVIHWYKHFFASKYYFELSEKKEEKNEEIPILETLEKLLYNE